MPNLRARGGSALELASMIITCIEKNPASRRYLKKMLCCSVSVWTLLVRCERPLEKTAILFVRSNRAAQRGNSTWHGGIPRWPTECHRSLVATSLLTSTTLTTMSGTASQDAGHPAPLQRASGLSRKTMKKAFKAIMKSYKFKQLPAAYDLPLRLRPVRCTYTSLGLCLNL